MLSAGIVVVVTIMNDSIKTEDDIEKHLGLSTLAVVPDRKDYVNSKRKRKTRKKQAKGQGIMEWKIDYEEPKKVMIILCKNQLKPCVQIFKFLGKQTKSFCSPAVILMKGKAMSRLL